MFGVVVDGVMSGPRLRIRAKGFPVFGFRSN